MEEFTIIIIQLFIPLALILTALVTGSIIEKKHFESIREREDYFSNIPVLNGKEYPKDQEIENAEFIVGSVVISIDYFKKFLAGLRQIFGGEIKSYISLLDRGRREAILRMIENANQPDLIINLRIETSSISKGRKKSIGSIEVLASATALRYRK